LTVQRAFPEGEKKMKIHLTLNSNNFKKLKDNMWECGWWQVADDQAQQLIGHEIFFHKKRLEPSFYGGTIKGYRVDEEGQNQGKTVFMFEYSQECRNIVTDRSGWSKEMKIISELDQ
jgi:hypothetical protein